MAINLMEMFLFNGYKKTIKKTKKHSTIQEISYHIFSWTFGIVISLLPCKSKKKNPFFLFKL